MTDTTPSASTMPATTVLTGLLLIAVGVIGYLATGMESATALLPALLGLAIAICGLIARRSEEARKHAVHAALALALIGALGSLPQVAGLGDAIAGTAERPGAAYTATAAVLVALVYVVIGVRSFIAARRQRG